MSLVLSDIIKTPEAVAKMEADRLLRSFIQNSHLSVKEKAQLKKSIVNKVIDIERPYRSDCRVVTPLLQAIYQVNLHAVRYLLDLNANVEPIAFHGRSLFEKLTSRFPKVKSLTPPFSMEHAKNALKIALLMIPHLDKAFLKEINLNSQISPEYKTKLEIAIQGEIENRLNQSIKCPM